jgi:hypothetical protein
MCLIAVMETDEPDTDTFQTLGAATLSVLENLQTRPELVSPLPAAGGGDASSHRLRRSQSRPGLGEAAVIPVSGLLG